MKKLILASGSPRRKELLSLAGFEYEVIPSDADESLSENLTPEETVLILSRRKAEDVFNKNNSAVVIGSDTVVAIDGKILGKPKDKKEAFEMLRMLSGNKHSVFSGVTVISYEKTESFFEKTDVYFFPLSDGEIESYIATGDCFDKAGGYGIQSCGCTLVEKINGDYFNVVGLPIAKTSRILKNFLK